MTFPVRRPEFNEDDVERHPARSPGGVGGQFRSKLGGTFRSIEALGYTAGAALIAGEIAEKAEKGVVGFERAHVVLEGMGLLHLREGGDSETKQKWAADISDRIGSETARRQQVRDAMGDSDRRRQELRDFGAAASTPSEADMLAGTTFGKALSVEAARRQAGPFRDRRNNAVRGEARKYLREQVADLPEPVRAAASAALTNEHVGEFPIEHLPRYFMDLVVRHLGYSDPTAARRVQEIATEMTRLIFGGSPSLMEWGPGSPARLPMPQQHPGQMRHVSDERLSRRRA